MHYLKVEVVRQLCMERHLLCRPETLTSILKFQCGRRINSWDLSFGLQVCAGHMYTPTLTPTNRIHTSYKHAHYMHIHHAHIYTTHTLCTYLSYKYASHTYTPYTDREMERKDKCWIQSNLLKIMNSKPIKNKFTLKLLIAFRRMDTRKEGMSIKYKEDKKTLWE